MANKIDPDSAARLITNVVVFINEEIDQSVNKWNRRGKKYNFNWEYEGLKIRLTADIADLTDYWKEMRQSSLVAEHQDSNLNA